MGRKCLIKGCVNRSSKNGVAEMVHRFPGSHQDQAAKKRKLWIEFAAQASREEPLSVNIDNFGICSRHFQLSDYELLPGKENQQTKKLKLDAVPSVLTSNENEPSKIIENSLQFNLEKEAYEWKQKYEAEVTRNTSLEKEIHTLKHQLATATKRESDANQKVKTIISRFTTAQGRMLLDPSLTYVHWDDEDMIKGLSLYSINAKAYEVVRNQWNIPLPSTRSLRRFLEMIPIAPDQPFPLVFNAINRKFGNEIFYSLKTQCILGVDEVAVCDKFCYDRKLDQIFGGEKNAACYCVKGLFTSWKMPLMYTFNQSSSHLIQLIEKLYENGLNVAACVSDMGPKNQKMWKDLSIGKVEKGIIQRIYFNHPVTSEKVFWFPDFPHLIKLLRDHMMETKITLQSGTVIDRTWIEDIINQQRSEDKLTHKLNQKHLHIRGQQKQNVRTAFQIFSHTTASAFRVLLKNRPGCNEVADTFELINDVSDLLNSRICHDFYNKNQCAFGKYLDEQMATLERGLELFTTMKVGFRTNNSFAPFQKGLIWNIRSLQGLYADLKERLQEFEFIRGDRLTQDFIENMYSILRSYGQTNNPDPVQLRHRLKKLVVTWSIASDDTDEFRIENLKRLCSADNEEDNLENDERPKFRDQIEEELSLLDPMIDVIQDYAFDRMTNKEAIREGSKEYIAGYMAKKLIHSYPELSSKGSLEVSRNGWVQTLSRGGLMEPSAVWLAYFSKFEEYFNTIHPPDSVCREPGVVSKLIGFLQERHPEIQLEILKFYADCRTQIRIKYLNIRMEDEKIIRREMKRLGDDYEQNDVRGLSTEGESMILQLESVLNF